MDKTNHELTGLILTPGMTKPRSLSWLLKGYRVLWGCEVFNSGAAGTCFLGKNRQNEGSVLAEVVPRVLGRWILVELSSELQAPKYLH